jgi:hypothetical protein
MGRGKYRYAQTTWYHPRSKNPYQIDHVLSSKKILKGFMMLGRVTGRSIVTTGLFPCAWILAKLSDNPRGTTDARRSHPSPGSGLKKERQEAVRNHVALLAGASVDGVTATKLQVLEAASSSEGRAHSGWPAASGLVSGGETLT